MKCPTSVFTIKKGKNPKLRQWPGRNKSEQETSVRENTLLHTTLRRPEKDCYYKTAR